jgi:hypothetical protein
MNACVIMHDMIIENKHDQELDYSFNELMEQYVHVQRREDRIAKFFLSPIILFVILKCTTIFKAVSWISGNSGMATKQRNK